MAGQKLIAMAAVLPLMGALAGVAAAETLFPETLESPALTRSMDELAPASVTVTVRTSSLAHTVAYVEDGTSFTVPVYFALEDASITGDALLVLTALADEAAAAPNVTITVSSQGYGLNEGASLSDMRAVNVFDELNSLGIPDRNMALELDEGAGASLRSDQIAEAI